MNGWIKVHRRTFDHDMFAGRPDWLGAWVMLLLKADHETGQLRASLVTMQNWFGWTPKRVRTFLQKLEEMGMIDRASNEAKKGTKGARISICNYAKFQQPENDAGTKGAHDGAAKGHVVKNQEEEVISDPNGSLVDNEVADPDLLGDTIKSKKSKSQPIAEAYQAYNATAERCGLPQATSLSPNRRKSIGARLRECGWDGWQNMLANVERSAFLTGSNDREWRVDLDWLIKPANFTKVSEGKYGNGRHAENDPADDWAVVAEQLRQQGYSLEGFQ